ncbi:MAG: bifunctional folylpolyglutamate synthase/dihydrofolate synthase, partial [Dehalococcoidia bacterium]|nr:bifunctional folylpolyglutamate synthase/dihydrofolate synthase [Dehalococcoidia bacterium]
MDYSQAEAYLHSYIDYEQIPGICFASADYSLEHVEETLHRLNDPHLRPKTVHIAGTKGKGSVAAMIARVLTSSGYRTGLYTSPHLHHLRERIRVDGAPISREDFAALIVHFRHSFRAMSRDPLYRQLTFFEVLTVLAFVYFREKEVDFQVLEVGLGGRLDATNVARPEVCVITAISLEHTEVLGDSLEQIANEKAGIIKSGSSVVTSPQPEEVAAVIDGVCRERGASLLRVGQDVTWIKVDSDLCRQSFTVESQTATHRLTMPLLGDYQLENAAAAVAALEVLASQGCGISAGDIARGLSRVEWPGRFQVLSREPAVLVDGAHNVGSMKRLVESIKVYFRYGELFLIVGISCDKDISGVVDELAPLSPRVIATSSSHPR